MSPDSPLANALRGALIAYGVAFFSWWFGRTLPQDSSASASDDLYLIAVGVGVQLAAWIAKWLAARYEREHGMSGLLTPAVASVVQLIIDGVTVMLFAIATFRSAALVPSSI
jgi:hypothetical protein